MKREFDLGDVLSVTTGKLVSRRHIDGIYDVLNFLTGDNLFTHQLPRAMDVCRPAVLAQHPELPLDAPAFGDKGEVFAWLDEQERAYGATVAIVPVAAWQSQDPIEELCDLVGPERIWVFPVRGEYV